MTKPDVLELLNECLNVIEHAKDDEAAERMLLIAFRLLHVADELFAPRSPIGIVERTSGRRALASLRYGHRRSSAAPTLIAQENSD
jgi:hypothetical protein